MAARLQSIRGPAGPGSASGGRSIARRRNANSIECNDLNHAASTGSDDPLITPLEHTFAMVRDYDVLAKVWNCTLAQGRA